MVKQLYRHTPDSGPAVYFSDEDIQVPPGVVWSTPWWLDRACQFLADRLPAGAPKYRSWLYTIATPEEAQIEKLSLMECVIIQDFEDCRGLYNMDLAPGSLLLCYLHDEIRESEFGNVSRILAPYLGVSGFEDAKRFPKKESAPAPAPAPLEEKESTPAPSPKKESARVSAYRFTTTDRNDPRIGELKADLKKENARSCKMVLTNAWGSYTSTRRVAVKGRLGPNRKGQVPEDVYRSAMMGSCPLDYASYFDVYVHEVRTEYPRRKELPRVRPPSPPVHREASPFVEALSAELDWKTRALTAEAQLRSIRESILLP